MTLSKKIKKYGKFILGQPYIKPWFANKYMFGFVRCIEWTLLLIPLKQVKLVLYRIFISYYNFFCPPNDYIISSELFGKISVNKYETVDAYLYYFGIWEPALTNVIQKNIDKKGLFIDLGANIGYYTLLAANLCKKVLSFEASPFIFKKLQSNLDLNNLKNVEAYNYAIMDKAGKILLHYGDEGSGPGTTAFPEQFTKYHVEVEARPLTSFLTNDDLNKISIIKIDIEGTEPLVLKDVYTVLDKFNKNIIFIIEVIERNLREKFNTDSQKLLKPFYDDGFSFYLIPNSYDPEFYLFPNRYKKYEEIKFSELNSFITGSHNDLVIARKNNIKF